ncbi:MAG: GGDEF domain-containing protein [Spirochaetes bacterium]|nr:GGDEF domain-containing protein [Spirochaetota bacterium]
MTDRQKLDEKIQLLRNASLFSKLREVELEIVAAYSEYYPFKKGEVIFNEGGNAEELYVIKEGEILITRQKKNKGSIDVARLISNEFFGELNLFVRTPRTATATAIRDTTLLTFPMKEVDFKDVLQKHPEISARILHKFLAIIAGRIRNTNTMISEKTPWIRDLRRQLFSDKLTGLYNRTYVEEDLVSLLPKYGESTSLIMIKPDNFKEINDKFGHDAGDKVLRLIAIFLQSILRESDIGIRYRGDELAALLPDTETGSAMKMAEDIRSTITEMDISNATDGKLAKITVSVGVATYPYHATNSIMLADRAHEKMFEAREKGGNRIICA